MNEFLTGPVATETKSAADKMATRNMLQERSDISATIVGRSQCYQYYPCSTRYKRSLTRTLWRVFKEISYV